MEHNNSNNDNVYNIDLVTATKEKYVAYLLENSKALGFSTKDSIDLPFAVDKTGELILLSIGDGQQGNALIIGIAGSGKSTIIYAWFCVESI